jgi:uncharacterized membrane protein YfcA
MARHALLGGLVIVFCVAGLIVGIVRLAPGRDATDLGLAVVAALIGAGGFWIAARLGRRGSPPWLKWLIVPGLIAAFYLDRLSERLQLALIALASGYVLAFVVTIVVRVVRITR